MRLLKKLKIKSLNKLYRKLMEEAYELSKVDRALADRKTSEAEMVLKQIEQLQSN